MSQILSGTAEGRHSQNWSAGFCQSITGLAPAGCSDELLHDSTERGPVSHRPGDLFEGLPIDQATEVISTGTDGEEQVTFGVLPDRLGCPIVITQCLLQFPSASRLLRLRLQGVEFVGQRLAGLAVRE